VFCVGVDAPQAMPSKRTAANASIRAAVLIAAILTHSSI
jgi:hypothetical protein